VQFAFSAEQVAFRDSVRALLKRECAPTSVRAAWSNADGRVAAVWQGLAQLGVFGVLAPEEDGGLAMSDLDLVLVLEECGRFAAPGPVSETAAVAVPLLRALATGSQRGWLRSVAAGEAGVAVGLAPAPFVLGAEAADVLVLQHGDEVHMVDRGAATLEAQPAVDGARRLSLVRWTLSPATRLASGQPALAALESARERAAVAAAAELIGLSRHMLETTVEYAKVRHQFGKPIGSFQAVKHHLADAVVAIEMATPAVYRAAYSLSLEAPDRSLHASTAKALASDAATLVARKALQCHGAIGYAFENDLQLWMKRAWALAAAWGDAASHRAKVAATLFAAGGT
jgi:alkylation response protein AidB-like acyl-CoA dehydrogenase